MIENPKNSMEIDAHRRTVSHFIPLCEKFLTPLIWWEKQKNRRTALKLLSTGLKMSQTVSYDKECLIFVGYSYK